MDRHDEAIGATDAEELRLDDPVATTRWRRGSMLSSGTS
jgi:hypothetical protein